MHAQITQDELVLEDSTANWKFMQSFLPGSLSFSSAEWIAEAPAKNAPTDFGDVHFNSAAARNQALNGGAIESQAWSDDAITLIGGNAAHPTALATPGPLEEEGRVFTITQDATGLMPPPENDDDRPQGRSLMFGIAGAGFEPATFGL